MFSDNGKTFVGANIELKKLHDLVKAPDETLVSHFNDEHIDWNFIPPRSPNFGGLWESGTLALIKNESLLGTKWLTGRILEVSYGNDNKIRVVNIKLLDGKIIKITIRDICLLPIE
ncbi:pro-Pol polyprotein [Trichonephila clavipes]|uniref:Pro-Pol polyprotein n=1 Tax=Trichonephila clavipes TaxID=2585209 RepID=A0A8X6VJS1_TRICX|nr:pro-Pol polyprotein [Trichonephila clavipes]